MLSSQENTTTVLFIGLPREPDPFPRRSIRFLFIPILLLNNISKIIQFLMNILPVENIAVGKNGLKPVYSRRI